MTEPVKIHPKNPKLFEYCGKPLVLITPTEHYGAVMNRPFRYGRYVEDMAARGINYSRLFILFRELQNHLNPYSTCKPETPDYIAPYPRVTQNDRALDGMPKFDLDRWNPEFFDRLHDYLCLTEEAGVIVEVVLLSNTYGDSVWMLNPLNKANTVSDVEAVPWYRYNTVSNPLLHARQRALVDKVVREVNGYSNVVFEICNEPGGDISAEGAQTKAEVDAWLSDLIRLVRDTEAGLPNRHLVFGQETFAYQVPGVKNDLDVFEYADDSFDTLDYDVVNMHALSNMWYRGRHYNLGRFMHAEINLAAFRDFNLDIYFSESKPLCQDEDNCASQFKNEAGWVIHRKRAWTAVFCGTHYDYIDFSIWPYLESGTDASRTSIRAWFGHLSAFVHALDLVTARPLRDAVTDRPPHCVESAFGVLGNDISIYIADSRCPFDEGYGEEIRGGVTLDLASGTHEAACFSPMSGGWSPSVTVQGGPGTRVSLPPFHHDLVIRLRRPEQE